MQRLRPFFHDFHALINGYGSKNPTGVWINDCALSEFFPTVSHAPYVLDDDEDEETIGQPSLKSRSFEGMLHRLGLPDDLNFRVNGYKCELNADSLPLGFALHYRDVKFARHAVLEVGSDVHHIRIDIKDSHSGDLYPVQIDQITLWDSANRYRIPLSPFYLNPDHMNEPKLWQPHNTGHIDEYNNYLIDLLEDITGTVDLTVQGINNGDEDQAYEVFADIGRILGEIRPLISTIEQEKARLGLLITP